MKSLSVTVVAVLVACAHPEPVRPATAVAVRQDPDCPMQVPGSSVSVGDEHGGAGLFFFTTRNGSLSDLRARVRRLADRYERAAAARPQTSPGLLGMIGERPAGSLPAASVLVEDFPGGADIILTAHEPTAIEPLRRHVRHDAERLRRGACP